MADQGDANVRAAYIELGDRLGWRGIVATKLVEWWLEAKPSPERTAHLRGAFERFAEVGRDEDAVRVACEIVRSKGADRGARGAPREARRSRPATSTRFPSRTI